MYEELEELQKEVARLNARVEVMESKVAKCFETVAGPREELERLKRRVRGSSLRGYMEAFRAYDDVEAGGHEPP
jgi:ubiquinone biosynthesis protein UbiJ